MAFQLVSLLNRNLSRDWTQQELAEFYRVESVLGAAGIAVDMDRGLSDEGDPWFAFCRPQNGDVIIHFARYDGLYIAASGALEQVLRGRDFRELVDAFIARQPLVMPGQKNENKVILHPSTLLTALVATALFLLEHQKADASQLLTDVVIEAPNDASHLQPHHNKFGTLINILLEPLRPQEQRDALFAIGAIIAGITALSYDAAKESPSLAPPIEVAVAQQHQENQEIEEDRLLQINQETSRKVSHSDEPVIIERGTDENQLSATSRAIVAKAHDDELRDALDINKQLNQSSASFFQKLSQANSSNNDDMALALTFDHSVNQMDNALNPNDKSVTDTKHTNLKSTNHTTSQFHDTAATITIAADKADLVLQDSLAASLTKNFGMGSFVHLNLADARGIQQLASLEINKSIISSNHSLLELAKTDITSSVRNAAFYPSSTASPLKNEVENKYSPTEAKAMEAISFFAKTNPDFKITQLGKDIILFDFDARPDNKIVYDVHSWDLPDGSKITIIGTLPEQFQV